MVDKNTTALESVKGYRMERSFEVKKGQKKDRSKKKIVP